MIRPVGADAVVTTNAQNNVNSGVELEEKMGTRQRRGKVESMDEVDRLKYRLEPYYNISVIATLLAG